MARAVPGLNSAHGRLATTARCNIMTLMGVASLGRGLAILSKPGKAVSSHLASWVPESGSQRASMGSLAGGGAVPLPPPVQPSHAPCTQSYSILERFRGKGHRGEPHLGCHDGWVGHDANSIPRKWRPLLLLLQAAHKVRLCSRLTREAQWYDFW